jgi:integrase
MRLRSYSLNYRFRKSFMTESKGESPNNDGKNRPKRNRTRTSRKKKRKACNKGRSPIRLTRRELSDGRKSLYLDIYWQGKRSYEFLGLYLTPEDKGNTGSSNINKLSQAEIIRAQRLHALAAENNTNSPPLYAEESFCVYYLECMHTRRGNEANYANWDSAYKHLMIYTQGKEVTFAEVNFKFLLGFKTYLLNAYLLKSRAHKLKQNTAYTYMNKIKAALTLAFEEGKILVDIGKKIYVKPGEANRETLDWQEVVRLAGVNCENHTLKQAFFFCLLTGLRFSDMVSMTWSEVLGNSEDGWYLKFNVKKNGRPEHLPITKQAREILGETQASSQKVFTGLIYSTWVTTALTRWMANAKIWRKITFHCARHTHATLLLDQDVDIYTVSKLLGHKNVYTTQIYTKVSVNKRKKALEHIPLLPYIEKLVPEHKLQHEDMPHLKDAEIPLDYIEKPQYSWIIATTNPPDKK